MKIAAYNVENLFDRTKAFNLADDQEVRKIVEANDRLNALFDEPVYTPAVVAETLDLMRFLELDKSDSGPFVTLRQIRGRAVRRSRTGSVTVVAGGRGDWVGWAELRTAPVNEIGIMNLGRVLRDVNADILAVVEAEDRVALRQFSEFVLAEVGGRPYAQVMVIDGNDERGIDVGLMVKPGFDIGLMRSHIHDAAQDGRPIYSRDCPEFAVTTPAGETIWVLPNHFKSKFGGNNRESRRRRRAQATRTAEIYEELRAAGNDRVIVVGDLNDTPASDELAPLLSATDLVDVSRHPSFDPGEFRGIGTFGLGNDSNKIDYLLLSPVLFERVTAGGLFRKGAWPGVQPKRWTVYPELQKEVHVASDHHVIWAEIAGQ